MAYINIPDLSGGGGSGAVDSVNGLTGVVILDTDSIPEGSTNKYLVTGTSNTPAYFNGSGDLNSLPATTINSNFGSNTYIIAPTPVDAGDVYDDIFSKEVEINTVVDTVQYHPRHLRLDMHVDRSGSGFDLNDASNLILSTTMEGSGTVGNAVAISSGLGLGIGNPGNTTNATHLSYNTSVGLGHAVNNLTHENSFIDITGTVTDLSVKAIGVNGDITNNLQGITYNHNGNIGANATVANFGINGDVVGNAAVLGAYHNGDSNGLTLLNLNSSGGTTHGYVQGVRVELGNADTNGKTAVSVILGDGTSTGGSRFFELNGGSGTHTNFIGLNMDHQNLDAGGSETSINIGKSTVDAINYTGINFGGSGAASNSFNHIVLNSNPSTPTTNMTVVNASPGSCTVTNAIGVNSNLTQVSSSNFKQAITSSGGSLNSSYDFNTNDVTTLPNAIISMHNIGSNFHIASGSPITTAGPLTPQFGFINNLGGSLYAEDNWDADFTGARLGTSFTGSFGQVAVVSGKTIDRLSMSMAAGSVPVLSTGGTIPDVDMYRAIGLLPDGSGGTLNITNMVGFHVDSAYSVSFGTNKWAFKDSSGSENFLSKLAINTASEIVSGSNSFEVLGDSFLDGGLEVSGNIGFFGTTPIGQQIGGAATAGVTYTATEQNMLQTAYDALRTYGLLT